MKKNKIFNKILYLILLMSLLLANSIGTAQALFGGSGPSVPSVGEVIDKVEKHYGFDGSILRRSQKKGDYPQVEVFFNKTSPKKGDEVTATAMPKHFKNTGEQLYYTWFLIRASDDEDGDDKFSDESDLIEKAKQRAMGIVARGDFDYMFYETDYSSGSSDPDEDGYEASYGGGDGVGGKSTGSSIGKYEFECYVEPTEKQIVDTNQITRCYRHNFGFSLPEDYSIGYPGEDLIIECEHKFPSSPEKDFYDSWGNHIECKEGEFDLGDGEFTTKEEACWGLDPNNSDTDGDGFLDEADLVGLGQSQLTWKFEPGDRVGVVIEGTSMVPTNESEGGPTVIGLGERITYNCSNASNGDYCVSGGMSFGECVDGECVSSDCDDSSNEGNPCGTNGICSYSTITETGSCDEVSTVCASSGDLCRKGNIIGTCMGSECVLSRCGAIGDKCQTDTGTLGTCDFNGYCQEDTDSAGDQSMNPYYKITWAGLDVCDQEKVGNDDKDDFLEDDECENGYDYGFPYLATKKVSEESEDILKPTLISNVSEAQVDLNNLNYSDYIKIKVAFDNQTTIDPDFIKYNWSINLRNENEVDIAGGDLISQDWVEGEINQGVGASSIKFRGKKSSDFKNTLDSYSGQKLHFFIGLDIVESGKRKKASIKIPIIVNDVPIKIYDKNGSEICKLTEDLYGKVCPVYPGQTVYAVYGGGAEGNIIGHSWELEGEKLLDKKSDYSLPSVVPNNSSSIVVPIFGSSMELQTLTLKTRKENGDEIVSERFLSIAKPMAKIKSNDENTAWPIKVNEGDSDEKDSENVFGYKTGELISLKADIVPNYLDSASLTTENIVLEWYMNDQKVTTDFIVKNSDNNIEVKNETIKFKLLENTSRSTSLTLKVVKKYTEDEKDDLKNNWGVNISRNLIFEKSISLKKSVDSSPVTEVKGSSISVFMASTLNNAPEYFIFIIKTTIVFILFWFLLYGFSYWFNQEVKLKKLND